MAPIPSMIIPMISSAMLMMRIVAMGLSTISPSTSTRNRGTRSTVMIHENSMAVLTMNSGMAVASVASRSAARSCFGRVVR